MVPLRTVVKGDGTTASFGSRTGLLYVGVPDRDTAGRAGDLPQPLPVRPCRPTLPAP